MSDGVVLVVDPDAESRGETIEGLRRSITGHAPEFEGVGSVDAAETVLKSRPVECVVSTYDLGESTGLEVFERVRAHQPDAGCVLYSATDPESVDTDAHGTTIAEYVDSSGPDAIATLAGVVEQDLSVEAQTSYPLPPGEADRRVTIEGLDLEGEELRAALGRLTQLAAEHFDVTHATVNVVREHTQEFLACYGQAAGWSATSREDSICTFTIAGDDDVFRVPDVADDPRFAEQESLQELGFRSYLGAKVFADGAPIGTVCVYDASTRSFSTADEEYLKLLADLASDLIRAHGGLAARNEDRPEGETQ